MCYSLMEICNWAEELNLAKPGGEKNGLKPWKILMTTPAG